MLPSQTQYKKIRFLIDSFYTHYMLTQCYFEYKKLKYIIIVNSILSISDVAS